MKLVKAERTDAIRIMEIINEAKAFLRSQGVNQWQTGYPAMADINKDLSDGIGYVLKDQGRIVGYAGIDARGEAAYDTLQGHWLNDEPYLSSIGCCRLHHPRQGPFPRKLFKGL